MASDVHPAFYHMGSRCYSLGVKEQGLEGDHSLLSSEEIKAGLAISPLPQMPLWHNG
jgi:hypothetical protein